MSQWDDFENTVKTGAEAAAVGALKDLGAELQSLALDYIQQAKADLELWTAQLAKKEITAADLADNVKGDADLAKIAALTAAGILEADLQRLRDALVKIVIDAATKAFPVP